MDERAVLFWVFVSFFSIIGVVSLLAVIGILKTDPSFRRWAIGSFLSKPRSSLIITRGRQQRCRLAVMRISGESF